MSRPTSSAGASCGSTCTTGACAGQFPPNSQTRSTAPTIDRVDRRSKYLLFHAGDGALLVHLGMTGNASRLARRRRRARLHDHVDIMLDDGTRAALSRPAAIRRDAVDRVAAPTGHPLLDALGPEPFDPAFDADYLWRATRTRRAAIKLALMDNHVVTGVGNIYANEALFRAGIRPSTPANRLSKARLARLVDAVRAVLDAAIAKGGSTLRDYVGSDGAAGYFQLDYFVYGRAGDAVPRLRSPDPASADRAALDVPLLRIASRDERIARCTAAAATARAGAARRAVPCAAGVDAARRRIDHAADYRRTSTDGRRAKRLPAIATAHARMRGAIVATPAYGMTCAFPSLMAAATMTPSSLHRSANTRAA